MQKQIMFYRIVTFVLSSLLLISVLSGYESHKIDNTILYQLTILIELKDVAVVVVGFIALLLISMLVGIVIGSK